MVPSFPAVHVCQLRMCTRTYEVVQNPTRHTWSSPVDWESLCSLNFKSHNFQTESYCKRDAPTYRGSTTLSFLVLQLCLTLKTLWIQNPAHVKQYVLRETYFFCTCPKPFTGVEEYCLGEVYKGRSRLWKCDAKLIMDLIWFKVKKQLKRERVCSA